MFNLIFNENMKIYKRKTFFITMIILISFIFLISLFSKIGMEVAQNQSNYSDWREELENQNHLLMKNFNDSSSQSEEIVSLVELNQYRINNDLPPNDYNAVVFLSETSLLIYLITLIALLQSISSISSEFKFGTIKLLLTKPFSRIQVLLSKHISILLYSLILLLTLLTVSFIFGGLFFSFSGLNDKTLIVDEGQIVEISLLYTVVDSYVTLLPMLILIPVLGVMLAVIFESTAIPLSISIVLLLANHSIVNFLEPFNWSKFIYFEHLNLSNQDSMIFSSLIIFLYSILFFIGSVTFFKQKKLV